MDKYIVESEAATVEVDGEQWTIILLSLDYGSPEARTLVSDAVWKALANHDHLLQGMRRSDGTIDVVASPELQEKIRAKIEAGLQWKKVRLYPP